MEFTVKREGFSQYIELSTEQDIPMFEVQMMEQYQQIKRDASGLLPILIQEHCFQYETKDMCSVESVIKQKSDREQWFYAMFLELVRVLEELEEWMLSMDSILLNPQLIHWKETTQRIALVYVPGHQGNIREEWKHLIEYCMQHINHSCQGLVMLIYQLYKIVQEDYCSMDTIKQCILECQQMSNAKPDCDKAISFRIDSAKQETTTFPRMTLGEREDRSFPPPASGVQEEAVPPQKTISRSKAMGSPGEEQSSALIQNYETARTLSTIRQMIILFLVLMGCCICGVFYAYENVFVYSSSEDKTLLAGFIIGAGINLVGVLWQVKVYRKKRNPVSLAKKQ